MRRCQLPLSKLPAVQRERETTKSTKTFRKPCKIPPITLQTLSLLEAQFQRQTAAKLKLRRVTPSSQNDFVQADPPSQLSARSLDRANTNATIKTRVLLCSYIDEPIWPDHLSTWRRVLINISSIGAGYFDEDPPLRHSSACLTACLPRTCNMPGQHVRQEKTSQIIATHFTQPLSPPSASAPHHKVVSQVAHIITGLILVK